MICVYGCAIEKSMATYRCTSLVPTLSSAWIASALLTCQPIDVEHMESICRGRFDISVSFPLASPFPSMPSKFSLRTCPILDVCALTAWNGVSAGSGASISNAIGLTADQTSSKRDIDLQRIDLYVTEFLVYQSIYCLFLLLWLVSAIFLWKSCNRGWWYSSS